MCSEGIHYINHSLAYSSHDSISEKIYIYIRLKGSLNSSCTTYIDERESWTSYTSDGLEILAPEFSDFPVYRHI